MHLESGIDAKRIKIFNTEKKKSGIEIKKNQIFNTEERENEIEVKRIKSSTQRRNTP